MTRIYQMLLKSFTPGFACTQLSGNFASRKRKRIMFDNDVLVIQHTLSSCNKCIFIHWMNTLIIIEAVLIIKGGDDCSARFRPFCSAKPAVGMCHMHSASPHKSNCPRSISDYASLFLLVLQSSEMRCRSLHS